MNRVYVLSLVAPIFFRLHQRNNIRIVYVHSSYRLIYLHYTLYKFRAKLYKKMKNFFKKIFIKIFLKKGPIRKGFNNFPIL